MKFSQFKYERPDIYILKGDLKKLIQGIKESNSKEEQISLIKHINSIRNDIDTMMNVCDIRHTINTQDKFYEEEKEHFDKVLPIYQGVISEFYKTLINSKFKKELEDEFGSQLFNIANASVKVFSEEVIEDLQLENKISSEYTKLLASANIPFMGEERNLAGMVPFQTDKNRETRKSANEARYKFFSDNEEKLDQIYGDLVKVRTKIAKKLGYKNFVDLAYDRLCRSDYNKDMVKVFRNQVLENIVPVSTELYKRQKERLNLNSLKYYDENFKFLSGNALPKGDANWILNNGKKMYSQLSKETEEFFDFMLENELLDVLNKKGKASGGYCTDIPNLKAPFIFANFNGTSGDVDVLTHEAGHAFQGYCSRNFDIPEYLFPTLEACEIHSMSMEFFTWPWMKLFFEEDEEKYKFGHISSALTFIPYGVSVDEFQHFVYENPEITPDERKKAWRDIEKKYLPHRDYEDNEFLNKGTYWYQQGHIFESPFYYIDYTLAQICALQFFEKMTKNRECAWNDYLRLCSLGGSKSFLSLLKDANLKSPFEKGTLKPVMDCVKNYLSNVDDKKL